MPDHQGSGGSARPGCRARALRFALAECEFNPVGQGGRPHIQPVLTNKNAPALTGAFRLTPLNPPP
jgi:hypothetical protein